MAGTTADKLGYLNGTRDTLESNLIAKGMDVTSGTTFRQMAEMVGDIKTQKPDCKVSNMTNTVLYYLSLDGRNGAISKGNEVILPYGSSILIHVNLTISGNFVQYDRGYNAITIGNTRSEWLCVLGDLTIT